MQDIEKTLVIFRMFKEEKEIIAIFPEEPGNYDSNTCSSYVHVGQHGTCDPQYLIQDATYPAYPFQYQDLKEELEKMGYNLVIKKKYQSKHYETRQKSLKQMGE